MKNRLSDAENIQFKSTSESEPEAKRRVNELNSLSQLCGYRIKYESIRRTKLYQNLKE